MVDIKGPHAVFATHMTDAIQCFTIVTDFSGLHQDAVLFLQLTLTTAQLTN